MCGLVGVAGDVTVKEKQIFTSLLFLNVFRGQDGCGVFSTWKDHKKHPMYNVERSTDRSSEFVFSNDYKSQISQTDVKVLMGHSRAATVGKVSVENNHPFEVGSKENYTDLVGAHNGTIRGRFDGHDKHETDSEALYNLINKIGLRKALLSVEQSSYSFAYALSYYKFENECLVLIRNTERPLFYTIKGSCIFWSSNKTFLQMAFLHADVEIGEIKELAAHSLLNFFPYKEIKDRLRITKDWIQFPVYTPLSNYNRRGWNSGAAYGGWSGMDDEPWEGRDAKVDEKKEFTGARTYYTVGQNKYSGDYLGNTVKKKGCVYCTNSDKDITDYKFNAHGNECVCVECEPSVNEITNDQYFECKKLAELV